ncbi:hypothetical protein HPP92_018671 [Vanilla planifolia]|uniref:F-box domain-containing protein n=1 Tax=Vanilla planifolia TaxID=51239 RepID=A0A835Q657_VANPL|nr:hypothetical protein HPP92_018671 [Vanilla planifolia]
MEEERRWEDLTQDCLVRVFCNLGLDDLTLAVPFVCRSWREASLDPQCWKHLDFRELDFGSGSGLARRLKQELRVESFSFSALMKLCLARSRGSAVELAIPSSLAPPYSETSCPRLKVLALPSLLRKDEEQLPELISKLKELEVLEITWKPRCFLEILEQVRLNCPNFIGLHLCGFFDNREAHAIVRCLPKLKILVLSASYLRKEDVVAILDGCTELEVVDVSSCRGFDADREILKKASGIKKFECGGCSLMQGRTDFFYDHDDVFMALSIMN